jgi:hypothetical protein
MSRSVRRLIPFAAVLVVLVAAGIAVATSTDPQVRIDPVDQAWADSIVLTAADLGKGWKIDRTGGVAGGDESSGDSTWCPEGTPSEPDLTITGGSASPDFKRKDDSSVSTYAFVWQTAEQAQADWERTQATMPALVDCFASFFETVSTHAVTATVTYKGSSRFLRSHLARRRIGSRSSSSRACAGRRRRRRVHPGSSRWISSCWGTAERLCSY